LVKKMAKMLAIVRIRGKVNRRKEVEDTMIMLGLKASNNCVVIKESPSAVGMMKKVKDFVTFGEIDEQTLIKILKKRGRIEGNKRLDAKTVKLTGYDTIEALAKDVGNGKKAMRSVPKLKSTFRLTPPSKGFKSTKLGYPKGDLGKRDSESMKKLIEKMI